MASSDAADFVQSVRNSRALASFLSYGKSPEKSSYGPSSLFNVMKGFMNFIHERSCIPGNIFEHFVYILSYEPIESIQYIFDQLGSVVTAQLLTGLFSDHPSALLTAASQRRNGVADILKIFTNKHLKWILNNNIERLADVANGRKNVSSTFNQIMKYDGAGIVVSHICDTLGPEETVELLARTNSGESAMVTLLVTISRQWQHEDRCELRSVLTLVRPQQKVESCSEMCLIMKSSRAAQLLHNISQHLNKATLMALLIPNPPCVSSTPCFIEAVKTSCLKIGDIFALFRDDLSICCRLLRIKDDVGRNALHHLMTKPGFLEESKDFMEDLRNKDGKTYLDLTLEVLSGNGSIPSQLVYVVQNLPDNQREENAYNKFASLAQKCFDAYEDAKEIATEMFVLANANAILREAVFLRLHHCTFRHPKHIYRYVEDVRSQIGDDRYFINRKVSVLLFYATKDREGAINEVDELRAAFNSQHIKVQVHRDFTQNEIFEAINRDESRKRGTLQIVVTLSHGRAGEIHDNNSKSIPLAKIEERMCLSHQNTPKILIAQCCQNGGDESDGSDSQRRYDAKVDSEEDVVNDAGPRTHPRRQLKKYSVEHRDFCAIISSVTGQKSFRNEFIPRLAKAVKTAGPNTNLLTVFEKAARSMTALQDPIFMSTMKFGVFLGGL